MNSQRLSYFGVLFILPSLVLGALLSDSSVQADEPQCGNLRTQWEQLKKKVGDWTKQPEHFVPAPPPVYQFDCYGESSRASRDARQRQETKDFSNQYFSEEGRVGGDLIRISGLIEACGIATEQEAHQLSAQAVEAMKARTLLQLRQIRGFSAPGKYDYYYGAIIGTYGAERAVSLLGGEFPELNAVRGAMLQELVDHLGSELVLKHDLQITPRAFTDILRAAVFGGLVDEARALAVLDRVLSFYRFQVDFDSETRLGNGDPLMQFNKSQPNTMVRLERVGSFGSHEILLRYRPLEMTVNETGIGQMEEGTLTYLQPNGYKTDFNFETFACDEGDPNVILSLSRFGADGESWKMCDNEGVCYNLPSMASSHIVAMTISRQFHFLEAEAPWPEALYSPMSPKLAFTFKVPLANRSEKIVDWERHGQFESDGQTFFHRTHWKVFHKPGL